VIHPQRKTRQIIPAPAKPLLIESTGTFAENFATKQTHAVSGFWVRSMMYEREGRNGQKSAAINPTIVTGPTMVSTKILLISEVSGLPKKLLLVY